MMDENVQGALNGQPEQQPQAPQQGQQQESPMREALLGWIRSAYGIAGMGPQNVRDVLTRAQQSYSDMVTNTLSKKFDEARKARYEWEHNTAVATDINRRRLDEYGEAWAGDAPMEEKMGRVAEVANRWGDQTIGELVNSPQQFSTFGKLYDQMHQQQQALEGATTQLDTQIKGIEKQLGPHMGQPQNDGPLPPIKDFMS